jgi:hypothetical protein
MALNAPTITNTNLDNTTRELWEDTVQKEVVEKNVLLARLLMAKQIDQTRSGGKYIAKTVTYTEAIGGGGWYTTNQPLISGSNTFVDRPYFLWKNIQKSTTKDLDEEMDNNDPHAVLDLSTTIVELLQKQLRTSLRVSAYDASTSSTDTGSAICSIPHALDHGDTTGTDPGFTYGGLSRDLSASTRDWWQSADPTYDFVKGTGTSTQNTAITASYDTFQRCMTAVRRQTEDGDARNYMVIVGPTLYRAYKAWVKADEVQVNPSNSMRKYGFNTFSMDGVEFVEDPTLTADNTDYTYALYDSETTRTAEKWFFLLYIPSWVFYIHRKRSFWLMPWEWQGKTENGYDRWLIRCMLRCALACWQPNANMWLTNMT